jgi:hypothetical protein
MQAHQLQAVEEGGQRGDNPSARPGILRRIVSLCGKWRDSRSAIRRGSARRWPPDACSARAKEASARERSALFLVVHLSSQRTLEPVRQDGCFAEKQGPGPALLLIVHPGRPKLGLRDVARQPMQQRAGRPLRPDAGCPVAWRSTAATRLGLADRQRHSWRVVLPPCCGDRRASNRRRRRHGTRAPLRSPSDAPQCRADGRAQRARPSGPRRHGPACQPPRRRAGVRSSPPEPGGCVRASQLARSSRGLGHRSTADRPCRGRSRRRRTCPAWTSRCRPGGSCSSRGSPCQRARRRLSRR